MNLPLLSLSLFLLFILNSPPSTFSVEIGHSKQMNSNENNAREIIDDTDLEGDDDNFEEEGSGIGNENEKDQSNDPELLLTQQNQQQHHQQPSNDKKQDKTLLVVQTPATPPFDSEPSSNEQMLKDGDDLEAEGDFDDSGDSLIDQDDLPSPKTADDLESPLSSTPVMVTFQSSRSKLIAIISKPGIMAGIIGGAVIGLLTAMLLIMFIVYRMRKKDEGSYALEETKKPLHSYDYRNCPTKEFYA